MEAKRLYRREVLRRKIPILHPRYQWVEMELEPDDRVVFTSINGHADIEMIAQMTGLPEESVVRVILKLFGRGGVLFDDEAPLFDEEEILELVPTFDPKNTNRSAHLDETDRRLLAFIDGRTPVRRMEGSFGLGRERLCAAVIRLQLAGVIGFANASGIAFPAPEPPPAPEPSPAFQTEVAVRREDAASRPATADPTVRTRQEKFLDQSKKILQQLSSQSEEQLEAQVRAATAGRPSGSAQRPPRPPSPPRVAPSTPGRREGTREAPTVAETTVQGRPSSGVPAIAKMAGLVVLVVAAWLGTARPWKAHAPTGTVGPTLTVESFRGIADLTRIAPMQAHAFQAWVAPSWNDLGESEKRGAVNGMLRMLKPEGVTELTLLDANDRKVAIWVNDRLILF